ncbi:hypothetical protein D3C78_972670 [compost metagenome]
MDIQILKKGLKIIYLKLYVYPLILNKKMVTVNMSPEQIHVRKLKGYKFPKFTMAAYQHQMIHL